MPFESARSARAEARVRLRASQLFYSVGAFAAARGSKGKHTTLSCEKVEAVRLALTPFGFEVELPAVGAEDCQSLTLLLAILPGDDPLILCVKVCND